MDACIHERFTIRETIVKDRAFRVYDNAAGTDAFLKCWPRDAAAAADEISMLTGIDSPHVPRFLCSFEEDGKRYLAEEWIEGETLQSLLEREGPLPLAYAAEIAEAVCDALSFLHWNKKGPIVMIDLKPSNVIVRGTAPGPFDVTLVDFEAARRLEREPSRSERSAQARASVTRLLGSPYYTAPEVVFGSLCVTGDIYSLGVMLYTMLTGQEGYPQPSRLTARAASIVRKCVAPDPKERYADVSILKEALRAAHGTDAVRRVRKSAAQAAASPRPDSDLTAARPDTAEERTPLHNFRRCAVMIDCNTCFASEFAQIASEHMALRTGVFALSEKGQRNLEYYFLNQGQACDLVCEADYYPFIFDHKSLYLRSGREWTERGLLHACSERLYVGSRKLLMELPLRSAGDYGQFLDWCYANFDLTLFTAERQDDPNDIDQIMKRCDRVIVTPLSNVEDMEAYRDYYVALAASRRMILSKVMFVAWDYREQPDLTREQIEQIVGKEKYLGEVSHSDTWNKKKNRLPFSPQNAMYLEHARQYEKIIERLIG